MKAKEFIVFCSLMTDVCSKAFGEQQLSKLPYGKAQTLSWLIHEATGELLSYKTLSNFISAVLEERPHLVNPSDATLSILAQFVANEEHSPARQKMWLGAYAAWYKYRSNMLTHSPVA
jgi:hypothetical protein